MSTHIVQLQVSNFKRIRAVEINPEGGIIRVAGRNGAGKSSVLDAIMAALGGKAACPDVPVHIGAREGEVSIALSNGYTLTRVFHASGESELRLYRGGDQIARPQTTIDGWLGDLTFDPLAFARLDAKKQAEVLRRVAGIDLEAIEERKESLKAARTELNREMSSLKARWQDRSDLDLVPDQPIDTSKLVRQLESAASANAEAKAHAATIEQRQTLLGIAGNAQRTYEDEIASLKQALARAEAGLAESIKTQADLNAEIQAMAAEAPVQVDAESIRAELALADLTNRKVAEAQARAADRIRYNEIQDEYNAAGRALEACDREKLDLFKSAAYPYEGLEYSDEGVLLGGVPFGQASTAEQLRASVAIGLAAEPQLRVMLVRDGSLLDSASMAELATIAQERDCQLWLEVVAERGPDGQYPEGLELIIEDGARVGTDGMDTGLFEGAGA